MLRLLLALFITWQAQIQLSSPRPQDGWVLYAAAVVLFIAATHSTPRSTSPAFTRAAGGRLAETPSNSSPSRPHMSWFFLAGLVGSIALLLFLIPTYQRLGWLCYALSLFVFFLAFLTPRIPTFFFRASHFALRTPRFTRSSLQSLLLPLILLLAFIIRIWQNDLAPPGLWYDEARVGLVARRILSEPDYRPIFEAYIERPLHDSLTVSFMFALFGDHVNALRLVTAIYGTLNVLMAYLLLGRWLGHSAGFMAAALWMVLRWDITFSRIKFDAVTTPFFIMFVLYLLDRGLERKRLADFALAGCVLGIGLAYYSPLQLFSLLLILIGLGLLIGAFVARGLAAWHAHVRPLIPHVLCFALGGTLAFAPVAEFALLQPDVYWDRYRSASIFYDTDPADVIEVARQSALKHLGMFNQQGDQNARHNLPGAPQLDPFMGALFVLGLALAVWRWRELPTLIMLLLFGSMLQGGIWSVSAEAPQAIRSIGLLPALIYFIVLALLAIQRVIAGQIENLRLKLPLPIAHWRHSIMPFAFVILWLFVAGYNLDLYFNQQTRHPAARAMHSFPEATIAAEMRQRATTHDFVIAWRYWAIPTIQFLAPGIKHVQWLTLYDLPLTPNPERPIFLYLDAPQITAFERIQRAYPAAELQAILDPDTQQPVAYRVELTLEMLRTRSRP